MAVHLANGNKPIEEIEAHPIPIANGALDGLLGEADDGG